ncbi:uncharacterized protein [Pyxicephalus adspersus]|uniref:uncharacterized protein n=1 Tax=Pyxicephalus adspersus TaxID=30357 RepID=UPI003B5B37D5
MESSKRLSSENMDDFSFQEDRHVSLGVTNKLERFISLEDEKYNDIMDLSKSNWKHTGLKAESKNKLGGSVDSILSQTSFQNPAWMAVKSSKSQDALASPSCSIRNQMWPSKENELESSEIVDDVVGDEINFNTRLRLQKETSVEHKNTSFNASPLFSHYVLEAATMPVESLPEHCRSEGEKLQTYLQEMGNYHQWTKSIDPNPDCSEETKPNHFQATESREAISMPLLKSILLVREARINDLSKEIRRIQSENVQLQEDKQHILSENEWLRRQVESTTFNEERKAQDVFNSFDPLSSEDLQKHIGKLKNQISALQEANERAVLELAKADEEISQQKQDLAKLKAEYQQKLEDSKEQIQILTEKVIYDNLRSNATYKCINACKGQVKG